MEEKKSSKWKLRWKNWVKATRFPGVWEREEGGHLVRTKVTDPTSGRRKEIKRVFPDLDAAKASAWLQEEVLTSDRPSSDGGQRASWPVLLRKYELRA